MHSDECGGLERNTSSDEYPLDLMVGHDRIRLSSLPYYTKWSVKSGCNPSPNPKLIKLSLGVSLGQEVGREDQLQQPRLT